eukprot:CAMPEP_0181386262 /NCGR_PEP_ID=MMETSP1106-20121128/23042_1 /TAXON_ID=81844 /ORGANISM="Mantoniella antarctica, Strain SL-175" /LENGTH=105 /DNA_ID=CAMNT_0023506463 /DNA_START=559 /DNA_END=873 /DNA_ORIENTATION=+
MYNVLKTKSSASEEQSLSRQSDHANKLIRQIESSIEHSEHARAKRFSLEDDEPVRGVPKPGEDLWSAMYADHDTLVKSQLLRAPTPACAPASPPVPDAGCSDASG